MAELKDLSFFLFQTLLLWVMPLLNNLVFLATVFDTRSYDLSRDPKYVSLGDRFH